MYRRRPANRYSSIFGVRFTIIHSVFNFHVERGKYARMMILNTDLTGVEKLHYSIASEALIPPDESFHNQVYLLKVPNDSMIWILLIYVSWRLPLALVSVFSFFSLWLHTVFSCGSPFISTFRSNVCNVR